MDWAVLLYSDKLFFQLTRRKNRMLRTDEKKVRLSDIVLVGNERAIRFQ